MFTPFHNQRYNIAWKYVRNKMYEVYRASWNDEDMIGKSKRMGFIGIIQMALDYCLIIYNDITLPNRVVGDETWEEVKARYDFDTHVKYFAKHNVNLKKIARYFDLEILAPLNNDSQVLIDAQPSNDIPIYP